MKKKRLVLAALLLAAVLTGCECKHTFTEADCLNPQVCTKCEELGAAALGHDFAPATCDVPETCTRCGETQGEKLEHVYSSWQFEGEEMFKTCENCDVEERMQIDREQYLKEELLGFWDFDALIEDGTTYQSYLLPNGQIGEYLNLKDDGTAVYYELISLKEIRLTWKYAGFDNSEGYDCYTISVDSEETGPFDIYIRDEEGTDLDLVYYFYGQANKLFMSRHTPFSTSIAGSWVCMQGAEAYTVALNPDHTFTLDIEPEISGTWHITAPFASGSSAENASPYIKLKLRYPSGDDYKVIESSISLGETSQSMEEMATYLNESAYFAFFVDELNTSLSFEKMAEEDLEAFYKAIEEGKTKILGNWTSKVIEAKNYKTNEGNSIVNTDYSIFFAEDGTFTAKLDEELTGTWTFNNVYISGDYVDYSYRIKIDGQDRTWSVSAVNSNSNLSLYYYEDDVNTTITFGQLSEDDKAKLQEAPQLIVGEWSCTTRSRYDEAKQEQIAEDTTGSMTFREDGTFTLALDVEYTGTWHFSDYSADSGYDYSVAFDHEQNHFYMWKMYTPGQISIYLNQNGIYYHYYMTKN